MPSIHQQHIETVLATVLGRLHLCNSIDLRSTDITSAGEREQLEGAITSADGGEKVERACVFLLSTIVPVKGQVEQRLTHRLLHVCTDA